MARRLYLFLMFLLATPAFAQQGDPVVDILKKVQTKWNAVQDYQCKMQSNNRLGAETDKKQIALAFKRRHQVRVEVLDGPKKGSVLTRDDAGVMMGKKGGLLGVVSVKIDEGDPRTLNLRGRKFYEADWGTVLSEVIRRVKAGWQATPIAEENYDGKPCYVIDLTGSEAASSETRDKIWVDKEGFLILRRQQYEGQDLVNEVVWWDILINQGIDDGMFRL